MFSTFTTRFWEFLLQPACCLIPIAFYWDKMLLRDERARFHSKPRYNVRSPAGPQLIYKHKNTEVPELRNKKCGTCHKLLNHNDVSDKNVLALSV